MDFMLKTRILVASLLALTTTVCLADYPPPGKYDFYMSVGVTGSRILNDQPVQLTNVVTNTYSTSPEWQFEPMLGFAFGHTFHDFLNAPLALSLDLAGDIFDLNNVHGTEVPFSNGGGFDTLNYTFSAESAALFFEQRLIFSKYRIQPYILGGVGASANYLSNYSEVPTNSSSAAAAAPSQFNNNTNIGLALEAGIGAQCALFKTEHAEYTLALDYRYVDLGLAQLGTFSSMTTNNRLEIPELKTNVVMLSLETTI
jgi:hypothetical protein